MTTPLAPRRLPVVVRCLLLALATLGLAAAEPPQGSKLRVVATFAPIYSWTANIAGPDAQVELLLPGDVGPHDFQLRPQDVRRIRQADLIIANGLGLEGWLEKAIRANLKDSGRKVVRASDGLKSGFIYHLPVIDLGPGKMGAKGHDHGHDHDHDHEAAGESPNPHVWLDPVLAIHSVSNIVAALSSADPAHAAAYRERGAAYAARLTALDTEIRTALAGITNRAIVTYHDAFPYFCRRYQLDLVGVVEEVPSVDPSPKYLAALSAAVRARNVRVIFAEPQFNPRLVRRLTKDLGVQFAELDVLETGAATPSFYEDGMRRNLKALQSTLR